MRQLFRIGSKYIRPFSFTNCRRVSTLLENEGSRIPQSRWNRAYDILRGGKKDLVNDFENIQLSEPDSVLSTSLNGAEAAQREK